MAEHSKIEWTEATWNPIAGCSVVSPGCTNCYAMRKVAPRLSANPATPQYRDTVAPSKAGPVWTGVVNLAPESVLLKPLRWTRPRMIFVNSTSDLFHEAVPDAWIDRIFAVMALCPQHTFQVLTKRPARMRGYLAKRGLGLRIAEAIDVLVPWRTTASIEAKDRVIVGDPVWGPMRPLPNVWLGTSVEDQARAAERIPELLATPAAVRFISAEPLLGPLDLEAAWHGESALEAECRGECAWCEKGHPPLWNCRRGLGDWERGRSGLDWVIVGGESGNSARPMHPDWARGLRDQCAAARVPFFFKQWGEWKDAAGWYEDNPVSLPLRAWGATGWREVHGSDTDYVARVGKHAAGRLLDGVLHDAMPVSA